MVASLYSGTKIYTKNLALIHPDLFPNHIRPMSQDASPKIQQTKMRTIISPHASMDIIASLLP
jgi:hypothetical protein